MAKQIIEFKLEGGEIPDWINGGGYFPVFDGNGERTLIGVSYESKKNFIPSTGNANWINSNTFISRVEDSEIYRPYTGATELMTTQEKTDLANAWLAERGL